MIIILMGVSGSGKTSVGNVLSRKTGLPFIDGDDYHSPENIKKMSSGEPLSDTDRKPWLETLAKLTAEANRGGGCILACSALKQSYREILAGRQGSDVIFIYLKGSSELISQRLNKRDSHYFPAHLLDSQFNDLEEPDADVAHTVSIDLKPDEAAARIMKLLGL